MWNTKTYSAQTYHSLRGYRHVAIWERIVIYHLPQVRSSRFCRHNSVSCRCSKHWIYRKALACVTRSASSVLHRGWHRGGPVRKLTTGADFYMQWARLCATTAVDRQKRRRGDQRTAAGRTLRTRTSAAEEARQMLPSEKRGVRFCG